MGRGDGAPLPLVQGEHCSQKRKCRVPRRGVKSGHLTKTVRPTEATWPRSTSTRGQVGECRVGLPPGAGAGRPHQTQTLPSPPRSSFLPPPGARPPSSCFRDASREMAFLTGTSWPSQGAGPPRRGTSGLWATRGVAGSRRGALDASGLVEKCRRGGSPERRPGPILANVPTGWVCPQNAEPRPGC